MLALCLAFGQQLLAASGADISEEAAANLAALEKNLPRDTADSCTDITVSSVKYMGPIRDQGQKGWCYAFSGADLVSAALKMRVSSSDIALQNAKIHDQVHSLAYGKDVLNVESGWSYEALNWMLVNGIGFCEEKTLPFAKVDQIFAGQSKEEIYKNLNRICQQRKKLTTGFVNFSPNHTVALKLQNAAFIDELLYYDKPVEIAVFPMMLGQASVGSKISTLASDGHSMILIGRRFNKKTQQCEYVLRNSWGPISTKKERQGQLPYFEDGNLIVGKTQLMAEMISFSYIQDVPTEKDAKEQATILLDIFSRRN